MILESPGRGWEEMRQARKEAHGGYVNEGAAPDPWGREGCSSVAFPCTVCRQK